MRRIAIVALVALSAACASTQRHAEAPSPCGSAAYQELSSRPVDELSEREYERLRELERACSAYQITQEEQRAAQRHERTRGLGVLFLIGAAVVAIVAGASI